ncbi:MAG: hypothetical protein QW046_04525 [Candidatus Micrarchaeaceae archaeon]
MDETIGILIWINEERFEKLKAVGLADLTKDVLAGMRSLMIKCTLSQKDQLLKMYPNAKFDSATTKTIELLPKEVKDQLFNICIKKRSTGPEVVEEFLSQSTSCGKQ